MENINPKVINGMLEHPSGQRVEYEKTWSTCGGLVAKSCLTLCNPMNCSPPGSSVHGISQAKILEWVAISSSRGSSQSWIEPESLGLAGGLFTAEPPGKPQPSDYSLRTLHDNITLYVKEALKAIKTNETVLIFR